MKYSELQQPIYFKHQLPIVNPPEVFKVLQADHRCCKCNEFLYLNNHYYAPPFEYIKIPEVHQTYILIINNEIKYFCKRCYETHKPNSNKKIENISTLFKMIKN